MSKEYPQIAEYIKTVPYPGERPPEQRNPDGTLKKREPVPDDKRRAAGRSDSEPRSASRTRAAAAGPRKRIDPQAPFLNSIYDAGVWWNTSEPDLTFFDVTPGKPRDLPLYRGGNLGTPADPAPRGFPLVLAKDAGDFTHGSGRLELGEKIFTDAAPLSARVMVNRVWGWHFDKHLVGTPSDFGIQGLQPTHPELLEDLSARFIASGWSLKWLHREIMLSATYRQSSKPRAREMEVDPTNQLLWRMNPRRMDIEAYRDSLLQASGKLDLTMYGPSQPDVDAGVAPHGVFVDQPRPQQRRHEAVRRAGAAGPHPDAAADAQSAAGAVCHEQQLRAGAGEGAGGAGRRRSRRRRRRFRRSTGKCSPEMRRQTKWRSA